MLEVFPTALAQATAAADAVEILLRHGLATHGRASLVGTGGRAPGPVYDRLSHAPLDWARIVVTLSDERCVAADAPEANIGLLRKRLAVGAAAEARLLPLWPAPAESDLHALQPFDAVILGMGEDGHIASLISGSPTLAAGLDPNGQAMTVLTPAGLGSPPVARISLTLAALLRAQAIFLLIAGDVKRDVIDRALAGADLPVRALLIQDRAPVRVLWAPSHEE